MSDARTIDEQAPVTPAEPAPASATEQLAQNLQALPAPAEKLDGVEEIDFLLEEIESKIAPLALA